MKKIISWLSTPYFFNPSKKFKLKVSFYHGLFIFLFLYIFKPFYLAQFEIIILEYTIGIGTIAFLATFMILYFPPLIFKEYFNEDNWTIGRNLFLMAIGVTFIGIILWFLVKYIKNLIILKNLPFYSFFLIHFWLV